MSPQTPARWSSWKRRLRVGSVRSAADVIHDLTWHVWRARVIAAVLLAAAGGLRIAPQARDALISLGQSGSAGDWAVFAASVAWLGLNAWYWSRFLLGMRERGAAGEVSVGQRRARARIRSWLPRAFGVIPFLGVAFALMGAAAGIPSGMLDMMGNRDSGAEALRMAAALSMAGGAIFLWLSTRRLGWPRTWRARLIRYGPRPPGAPRPVRWAIGPGARLMLAVTLLVSVGIMVLYGMDPVGTGERLQSGPTILLAAAGLLCGGTLLVWYGRRTGVPIPGLLLALAFGLAALRDADVIADNHDIRVVAGPLPPRPDIEAAFAGFMAASAERYPASVPVPVILVATGGGGLAAAYWTATVLGDMADADPGFATQLFAISGVSGGALGALAFTALLNGPAPSPHGSGLRVRAQRALGGDFLSPVLGAMLYPDLLQRFLPVPVMADRAAALERAWEEGWRAATGDNRLSGPFLALWPRERSWPALLLNGTSALTGGRVVTSNLALAGAAAATSVEATDLLRLVDADVPASTAVGNSARFPLLGPIGVARRAARTTGDRPPVEDLVADGGYFENFGATTLLDMLEALDGLARRDRRAVRFVVLQIVSDPDLTRTPQVPSRGSLPARGLSGPLETLLRSRGARGATTTGMLARRTAALGGLYVPIHLGVSPTGASAPLSWSLSAVARHVIDAQWTEACRKRLGADLALAPLAPATRPFGPHREDFGAMLDTAPCRPGARSRAPASR